MVIKIPGGWEVKKLGEIAEIIMGQSPKSEFYNSEGEGIPFLQGSKNFGYRFPDLNIYCSKPVKTVKKGDILFSVRAPVGELNIASNNICIGRGLAGLRMRSGNNLFLYYLLLHVRNIIISSSRGSVFNSITKKELENITVVLPQRFKEQQKIADILGSIDDQIENLMEQNKTIEEIAETIFKEWIIKKNNENWDRRPLDRIAIFLNGLPCQKYPPKNNKEKLPVLKIKELQNGFDKNSDWASSEIPSNYIVQNGDIVFSWSGTLMVKIWNGEKCFLNQHLFKVFSKEYPKWFYYFWIKHYLKHFIAIANSKATTMGHIKRKDLSKTLVKVPSHKELKKLDRILSPMIDKIITNNQKIQTLTQLRNTLLPKLITGEIRVKV